MNPEVLEEKLLKMVEEDEGSGDITSALTPNKTVEAEIIVKEQCVLSGISELKTLFRLFNIKVLKSADDGESIKKGQQVLMLSGKAHDILLTERTALNILSRMSGITSLTREFIKQARKGNTRVRVAATRKVTPLFGYFEKKAVMVGGGDPHRLGLYDMVLIKDNHIRLFKDVRAAVRKARESSFAHKVEIEVETVEGAVTAAEEKADIIMLDNMSVKQVRSAILKLGEKGLRNNVLIEVSGGVTLGNIAEYAACSPDIISVGRLTHSVGAKDFSLKIL
ncbi:MAG: carboxylating nicotinate-nucleotide diphosphorylase [Candidatus Altiarchaeota archaeon]|nr:carboxylating nicotinate-nucleotide diphosphorylase [Candidatus Altiarchaeota archaeon]